MLRLSLNHKLVGLLLLGCIGSSAILALVAVRVSTAILAEQKSANLAAVRSSRQHHLEQYFAIIEGQLRTFCREPGTAEAVVALADAFTRVGQETTGAPGENESGEALRAFYDREVLPRQRQAEIPTRSVDDLMPRTTSARMLQSMYIARNPNVTGQRDLLDRADEACDYNRLHNLYHPRTRDFLKTFKYYDIFLFDLDGNLVYSASKEVDFATNFLDGPYRGSNLATVYRQARQAKTAGQVFTVDYASYEPSLGAPASFVGGPIFRDGVMVGVAAFQLPIDAIDEIVRDPSGLGKSGQLYLVGADLLMRSNTRFRSDAIFRQKVATTAAERALAGETDTVRTVSFSGVPVLASFAPLRLGSLRWGIVSEIDKAEISAAARDVRNRVVVIGLAIALMISGSLWLLLNRLVLRPVRLLADAARRLQDGDYTARVDLPARDEIGRLAGTFNHMAESIEHDVEEQQRIAAALAASEERFDLTVRGSGDGLWDYDPATGELWYAERFRELLGYSGEEEYPNVVESWSDGLHPDDRQATLDAFAAHLARDVPYDVEYRLKTKTGEYRWFRARGISLRDETGRSYRAAGSITDITAQREAQEEVERSAAALAKSEERFALTVRGSGDGLWDHDPATGELWYAERFSELLGYSGVEEYPNVAESWSDGLHPDDRQATLDAFAAHLARDVPYDVEYRLKTKTGEYRWFRARGISLRDETGRSYRAAGSITDITERRESQEELQKLSRAVEQSPATVVITDKDGNIEYANPKFTEVTGYEVEEVLGKNPSILNSGTQPGEFYENLWRTIASGNEWWGEFCNKKKSGELYWESASISPIRDAKGEVTHYVAVKDDITERKQMEEQLLEAREAADAANEAKSSFLANMSHEIRTPMNGIIGMTELALDTDLNPEQRDYINTVQSSADALLALINDILDFSKIEAGKLELDPAPFGLRDALADMLNTLATRAHAKGLELIYDVPPGLHDALIGDVYRLRQIIVNLVGNAIKFTEEGEIVVEVDVVDRTEENIELHFAVHDTGVGIPPDRLEAVLRPFEQADVSTTREFGGTGLGLTISIQLAECMSGRLWVESELGRGSTFHFTAVLGIGEAKPRIDADRQRELLDSLPVLIVDDNETNRRILERTVSNWRMSAHSVSSGADALAAMDRAASAGAPYRLVLSDVNMPGMDGFGLFERLHGHAHHRDVTVILLTSASRPGDVTRCRDLGIAAHLIKPVKQSLLLDAIVSAVAGPGVAALGTVEAPAVPDETPGAPVLRILLAEDNPTNQKFAVRAIEKAGHSVVVANNGREAVDALEQASYDLVLMDVHMPEMDGFEATKTIRERERGASPSRRTPIIAMTANAMKGDRERCLDVGMDGYVSKPVKRQTLFAEIDRVLKDRR